MNLFVDTLVTIVLTLYYIIEATVLFFVPARFLSKNVKGQVVLITGAGELFFLTWTSRFLTLYNRTIAETYRLLEFNQLNDD
jgi:hypothetical protein